MTMQKLDFWRFINFVLAVGAPDTVIIKQEDKNGENFDENEIGETEFDQNDRTSSPEWEGNNDQVEEDEEEIPLKKLKKLSTKNVSTKSVPIKKVPREAPPPDTECSRCRPAVEFPNKHELRIHIEQTHPEVWH